MHTHSKNPSRFLVENMGLLPKGPVLDVAMGDGRNAVYLASKGFQVEGIDVSEKAIDDAKKLAHDNNVKINTHIVDLEKDTFIEENRYDVIICFNFLQRSLIPAIKEGLRPGGLIVYETYIIDQARFGRPTNPEYLLKHNELLDLFKDFRCLRYHEGIYADKKAAAGIVAEKH
ncbi:class I SAM-dependent methyltransferase [Thermodesulfobacteriota bacterium]